MSAVVYEVNLAVDAAVLAEYRAWLADHVAEILALPGFTAAQTWDVVDPPATGATAHLCVQYWLHNADALADYLRDHAPRLRADGIARFGERVRATRRVLHQA
ncbi:MAG: DUF4286 family protein [Arenimonas sp.]